MDKIKEIYINIVQQTKEMQKQRENVERQIESLLIEEREKMGKMEYELYRDKFYQVVMLAEEGGFNLGFRYAVQLMEECSDKSIKTISELF